MKPEPRKKVQQLHIDYILLGAVMLLVAIGILMVYSASFYSYISMPEEIKSYYYASIKYASYAVILMLVLLLFPYKKFNNIYFNIFITILTFALLIIVYKFGRSTKGATRWLLIAGVSIMPSEIAKGTLVMVISSYFSKAYKNIKNASSFVSVFIFIILLAGAVFVFTKDFSTALLIAAVGFSMVTVMGAKFLHVLLLLIIGVFGGVLGIATSPMRMARIRAYFDTIVDRLYVFEETKHQIMYSIYSIGEGGLKGVGLGAGMLKVRLPEPYSDFIFAAIAEELGLFGVVLVIGLFVTIIWRIFAIAKRCDDIYGFSIVATTGFIIAYQAILNIGVTLSIFPVTGITLPFVSRGGSSLMVMLALIGIVLNISGTNPAKE